jgi:hypothetical protein
VNQLGEVSRTGGAAGPPGEEHRSKPDRKRNLYEKQALYVSVAALVVATVGSLFTGCQAYYAYRTFDSQNAQLQIYGYVTEWTGTGASHSTQADENHKPTIEVTSRSPDKHISLRVRMMNTGHEATTIIDVVADIGEHGEGHHVAFSYPDRQPRHYCSPTGVVQNDVYPEDCVKALPHTMEPGTIYTVSIGLDDFVSNLNSCCRNGITVHVDAVGSEDITKTFPVQLQ